jgi:spermidine synthase
MFVGIAVLSASLLAFQVLLTRLCALRLAFHFGFLIISNSLLGIGASGSVLTLLEGRWRRNPEAWVFGASVAYVVSLGATWAFARAMPVPDVLTFGMTGVELRQFAKFAVFNLGLAVPFFFGGGAVGLILSTYAHRVNSVYASDLLGAGIGCLLCPMLLWPFGAGGCLCALAALGLLACAFVAPGRLRRPATVAALAGVVGLLAWMPSFDATFPVPGKKFLQVTRNQRVDLTGDHEFSRWSANSRIDVRRSPLPNWYCYGLGGKDRPFVFDPRNQARLGGQKWIMQDGDAGTFLTDYTNTEVGRDYLLRSLYALSGPVKKGSAPRVFVIGVGGGPDLWAHKLLGASYVKGIELNRGVLEVHETIGREFSRGLREDPNVEFVCDEGRSALMHDPARYDVIQMTGIDTWTSLASGAYVLAENYLYTVEAVQQMYAHLADGGILQITRMGADPEKLRLLVNVHHALLAMGAGDLQASVAVIGSPVDGLTAILVKKGAYTEQEVSRLEQFCGASGHQLQYLPLRTLDGNVVEQFLRRPDKDAFVRAYPRRITPTTDDQPYFFNFTRWDTPTAETKKLLAELVEVSQGNPLFLWGQLGFSTIVALLLIVVPLWFRRSKARGYHTWRFLVYFAGIGVGFIFLEIAMIQKLTLLLGQPLYSIVVTLLSILVFTGVGSFLSGRWLAGGVWRARAIPLGIVAVTAAIVWFGTDIVNAAIGQGLFVRAAVAALVIAPIALLLGMPFAHGIGLLQRINPAFVPWAWAVNGSATVVGSVVTVIVSMNFGFCAVLVVAAAIYLIAFVAVDRLAR